MSGPLHAVLAVEPSRALAGDHAAMILADQGCFVIEVGNHRRTAWPTPANRAPGRPAVIEADGGGPEAAIVVA